MNITYRLAEQKDARAVSELARELFPDACPHFIPADAIEKFNDDKLNETVFAGFLDQSERMIINLAQGEDGRLLGYSLLDTQPDSAELLDTVDQNSAYLSKFYVHPDARGTGVARELMDRVVNDAKDAGFASIFLGTNIYNDRANAFYAKSGFEIVGERIFPFIPGIDCTDYVRARAL